MGGPRAYQPCDQSSASIQSANDAHDVSAIVVKVSQGDDVRRLRVTLADCQTADETLTAVKTAVQETFATPHAPRLWYHDSSGACCDLTTPSLAALLKEGRSALRVVVAPIGQR